MVGGATGGYCAIGNWVMAVAPITIRNRAITHAKMGRSMKKRAMPGASQFDAAPAGAEAGALVASVLVAAGACPSGAAADFGCHGTGLTTLAPSISFMAPSTIT